MYSEASLYYLNQLGIRPWIKRTAAEHNSAVEQEVIKLLVLISANLSQKGQALLQQMLAYLRISKQEFKVVFVDKQSDVHQMQQTPTAVLVFGLKDLMSDIPWHCPVIQSMDPDYLIANPFKKRTVFHDLNTINQLF
jgi:DNA polymerase III psi subunit